MAEQTREFAHRLSGLLIGNAVHGDDRNAFGLLHRYAPHSVLEPKRLCHNIDGNGE